MVKKFLDLGKQPIANGFLNKEDFENEFFYNLSMGFDEDTFLVTQVEYVEKERMFNDNYAYRGSMSKTMRDHFANVSRDLKALLPATPKVLEIGSNDGVFLKNWDTTNTIAVEPCGNFAEETNELGYYTYNSFWDNALSRDILRRHGVQDLVFAANCMCHIPEIKDVFKAVRNVLSDEGVFVFEDPSLASMIMVNSYDQMYDEHAHIFSVLALNNLLIQCDLKLVRVDHLGIHGGSNRIYATIDSEENRVTQSVYDAVKYEFNMGLHTYGKFELFAAEVKRSRKHLRMILNECKDKKKVISYGATSKSTTVFNYCDIGTDLIEYITDTTPEKQGKYSPGMHIPIVTPEEGFNDSVDYAFLGAWNFAKEIIEKEKDFKGSFLTHVPEVGFVV